jgi:hypothetical protein
MIRDINSSKKIQTNNRDKAKLYTTVHINIYKKKWFINKSFQEKISPREN